MCVMDSNPHASRHAIDTATQVPIGRVADALASPVQEPPSYRVSVSCIGCETAAERKARATMQRGIVARYMNLASLSTHLSSALNFSYM